MTLSVKHNVNLQRFEVQVDGQFAFLSYAYDGVSVILEHTYVPSELEGRGVGGTLVRAALDEARQRRWKIVPRCAFVSGFIERYPECSDLVDPRIQS